MTRYKVSANLPPRWQPRPRHRRPSAARASAPRSAVSSWCEVAIDEFAKRGFHGTPTQDIADKAGISHAYLFRLFPTKTELFIAAVERCFERVTDDLRQGGRRALEPGERLDAMGDAYEGLLDDRDQAAHRSSRPTPPATTLQVRKAVRAALGGPLQLREARVRRRHRDGCASSSPRACCSRSPPRCDLLAPRSEVWAERLLPAGQAPDPLFFHVQSE